jgi:DNA-binding response OmpR family regulator
MSINKVLIVEDNVDLLRLYVKALIKRGYHVQTAHTFTKARDLLATEAYDLLLCDMRLGKESGLALLQEYRSVLKANNTFVMAVSAEDQFREACLANGADLFLTKPILPNSIIHLIEQHRPINTPCSTS